MAMKFDRATLDRIETALERERDDLTMNKRPKDRMPPGSVGPWYDVVSTSRATGYATVVTINDKGIHAKPIKADGSDVGWEPDKHAEKIVRDAVAAKA